MADDTSGGRFSFRRHLPALRLIEAPALALSPLSVILAMLSAVVIHLSGSLIGRVFPVNSENDVVTRILEQLPNLTLSIVPETAGGLSLPWSSAVSPVIHMLGRAETWNWRFNGAAKFAVALVVWSLVGTLLCRRTACDFANKTEVTLQDTVEYSRNRWLNSLWAPLIPVCLVLTIEILVAVIAMIGRLPYLGYLWNIGLSPVLALLGLAMALLLVATALTWPLMVASVAMDDCDSFGAFSRAYSSLTGRPWHLMVYILISHVLGSVLMYLAEFIRVVAIWSVRSGMEFGSNGAVTDDSFHWLNTIIGYFVVGVGVSYFWSATAVIYLLIRLDVDGVPLHRIAQDDAHRPPHDPLPVVGIPATDARTEANGSLSPGTPSDVL